ncbi:MAG: DUF389 domain-containing protein [Patescibacteria group bacterium]|nr:DUF389 domain-containing protein [Patescibacteria group bacterium]
MQEKNKLFDPSVVDHTAVIIHLVSESSPRKVFLMMVIISSIIATLGLLNNNLAIVIGAMLVAPLLWPILGISMGLLVRDFRMIKLAVISIFLALVLAIGTAMLITFLYIPLGATHSIFNYANYGFMLPVSIAAGAAAAFAVSYTSIKETVAGVAITVALLPPIVSIGIGLGATNWDLLFDSVKIFAINLTGIITTTFFVFLALGFHKYTRSAETAAVKEEKILKNS